MPPPVSVELRHVSKRFGSALAVHDLNLTIFAGEFFALLGPSGCGKTTTLRLIGGFDTPDSGEIRLEGVPVNHEPPYRRPVNMVFQQYALFPHLSVQDNIAFGLRVQARRLPAVEIARRIQNVLDLVQLGGLEHRRPHQLSGGQQQRVALARALVLQPRVLLLDEPLGALDRQLRKSMQTELRRLQRELGITFLYVTHDQDEALSMADRIAVMHRGVIAQLDTPQKVFQTPRSTFVAEFMGLANVIAGQVVATAEPLVHLVTPAGLRLVGSCPDAVAVGAAVRLVVRPEVVQVVPYGWAWTGDNAFPGRVLSKTYLGEVTELQVQLQDGHTMCCRIPSRLEQQLAYAPSSVVTIGWQAHDSHVIQE
ncbi:MAG: ABC transporter ATP-binding protein [Candidatus Tectimicrobiota bacterium]